MADRNKQFQNGIYIVNDTVYLQGKKLPPLPCDCKCNNHTIIGNKVFINGYEWKDDQWKRTLRALLHLWF